jgi:hypothetical protein
MLSIFKMKRPVKRSSVSENFDFPTECVTEALKQEGIKMQNATFQFKALICFKQLHLSVEGGLWRITHFQKLKKLTIRFNHNHRKCKKHAVIKFIQTSGEKSNFGVTEYESCSCDGASYDEHINHFTENFSKIQKNLFFRSTRTKLIV